MEADILVLYSKLDKVIEYQVAFKSLINVLIEKIAPDYADFPDQLVDMSDLMTVEVDVVAGREAARGIGEKMVAFILSYNAYKSKMHKVIEAQEALQNVLMDVLMDVLENTIPLDCPNFPNQSVGAGIPENHFQNLCHRLEALCIHRSDPRAGEGDVVVAGGEAGGGILEKMESCIATINMSTVTINSKIDTWIVSLPALVNLLIQEFELPLCPIS